MKWIELLFDNVWAVVIIAGVVMQLFQAITKRKGEGQIPPEGEQPKEYEFEDPELAARTRKIREEIQRKIAQRQRGGPEPLSDADAIEPPVVREIVVTRTESAQPARSSSRLDAQRQAEILEEQAALAEKLREVELMKAAAAKRTEFETATADHSAAIRGATRSLVLGDLRSPEALRRAFILREVLGPPVALRR
jgi:hypothetical protein